MAIYLLLILFCQCGLDFAAVAQALPARQPEQDACGALLLCGGKFFTPYSYSGYGKSREVTGGFAWDANCHAETNSVWLKIQIATAGEVVFSINPVDSLDDYDFSVFNITSGVGTCGAPAGSKIRCNGNCNGNCPDKLGIPSAPGGAIGLNYSSVSLSTPAGTFGGSFLKAISANAGDEYLILVDNFSQSASGFGIDFAGSTATFANDGTPPTYDSIKTQAGCSNNTGLTVHLSKQILCNSLASNGSQFQIEPAIASVASASGLNCSGLSGYTQDIVLTFSNPLPTGTYNLKPKAGTANGGITDFCENLQLPTDSITFAVTAPLSVNAGNDTIICYAGSFQLKPDITGGIRNKLSWAPASYLDNAVSTAPVSTPQTDITYTITVVPDGNQACARKDSVRITAIGGFKLLNNDTAVCRGQVVALNVAGDSRYKYAWSPTTFFDVAGSNFPSVKTTPDTSLRYTLTARHPGCKDSAVSVAINVEPMPTVIAGNDTAICAGVSFLLQPTVGPDWYKGYRYKWEPSAGLSNPSSVRPVFSGSNTLNTLLTVTTEHGCIAADSLEITVYPQPKIDAGPDLITAVGKAILLQAKVSGDFSLQWLPPVYLSEPTALQPLASPPMDQLYKLIATGENGCTATDSVWVKVFTEIKIPNAFSPNGDGINDVWNILGLAAYQNSKTQVFNRWGQQVFESKGYEKPWDGKLNGKEVPIGVYYYITDINENGYWRLAGSLTVIR